MSVVESAWAIIAWPFLQIWGFLTNVWTWLTDRLQLQDIVLPAIYDSAVWVTNQIPLAFGGGEPGEMIEASFVLGVATFFTGIVTGGAAWVIIGLWVVTGLLGVARFVPVVEKYWPIPEWRLGDSSSLGVL